MRETRPGEGRDSPQFNVSSPVSRIGGAGKANRAAPRRGVASPRGVILSHPFGGRHGEGGIHDGARGVRLNYARLSRSAVVVVPKPSTGTSTLCGACKLL